MEMHIIFYFGLKCLTSFELPSLFLLQTN